MRSLTVSHLGISFVAAATIWGCGSDREAKIPLDQANQGTNGANEAATPGAIRGAAKTALDSGNILFRAKAHDLALVQYRRSAQFAPTELAPLLGILMVAEATKNAKLAESTMLRLRELNPAAADSSAAKSHAEMLDAHSRARKAQPPPAKKQESGTTSG